MRGTLMGNEIFSIIMPAYNSEKTIHDSIASVLNQTFPWFKLYIINDASNDCTENIILSFNDNRIVYIKNDSNLGVALSRNKGIEASNGTYMAFLDSDDIWMPEKLFQSEKILAQGYNVVCSNYVTFTNASDIQCIRKGPEVITFEDLLKSNFIGNLTGCYNMKALGKIYQKKIGHEDYLMWLSILSLSKSAYCIQEVLAKYRVSLSSKSSNKIVAMRWQWNIYRRELNISFAKSLYLFSSYVFYALKKRV